MARRGRAPGGRVRAPARPPARPARHRAAAACARDPPHAAAPQLPVDPAPARRAPLRQPRRARPPAHRAGRAAARAGRDRHHLPRAARRPHRPSHPARDPAYHGAGSGGRQHLEVVAEDVHVTEDAGPPPVGRGSARAQPLAAVRPAPLHLGPAAERLQRDLPHRLPRGLPRPLP